MRLTEAELKAGLFQRLATLSMAQSADCKLFLIAKNACVLA